MKFKIYCVNIFEREDRYIHVTNEFKKYNIDVKFIRNFKHNKGGMYGCFESHIQCIKDAKKNNLDVCLIFEDDITLNENSKKNINTCLNFINNHKNIDILYSNRRSLLYLNKYYTKNIYSGKSLGTDCYFLNNKSINKILNNYQKYIGKIHYDAYLSYIFNNSFVSFYKIIKSSPFGSDNDLWNKKNFIVNLIQKLTKYTIIPQIIINYFFEIFFKFLIKYKLDNKKKYLIKFINKEIKKCIDNDLEKKL